MNDKKITLPDMVPAAAEHVSGLAYRLRMLQDRGLSKEQIMAIITQLLED